MIRIWNTYKVWLLIGLVYAGFYLYMGFKVLIRVFAGLRTKSYSSHSLSTKES